MILDELEFQVGPLHLQLIWSFDILILASLLSTLLLGYDSRTTNNLGFLDSGPSD